MKLVLLNQPNPTTLPASLVGLTLAALLSAGSACSSSEAPGVVCGPGTTSTDGTCLPAGADASATDSAVNLADASADASSDAINAPDGKAGEGGSTTLDCTQGKGPSMVLIASDAGAPYCIDSTEVTEGQYAQFLGAVGNTPSGQPSQCSANVSFLPDHSGTLSGQCTSAAFSPATDGTSPVVCVDWCDAYAYCAWAGKRLCGGLSGAAVASDAVSRGNTEFTAACSSGGPNVYPYGTNYMAGYCVDAQYNSGGVYTAPLAVATATRCQADAPFSGVYDLVGNATEWIDACDSDDPYANCAFVGGSFVDTEPTCGSAEANVRSDTTVALGFRCCL